MLSRCLLLLWCPGLLFLCLTTSVQAQWGHFKGRIVVDRLPAVDLLVEPGTLPAAPAGVPDEKLVVDKVTLGLANVLIYPKKTPSPVHPDLKEPAREILLAQVVAARQTPHVLVIRTDQKLQLASADPGPQNFRATPLKNPKVNITLEPGRPHPPFQFVQREPLPAEIRSDLHPWMQSYWLIVDHPYAAKTDERGEFEIRNLPVGEHNFRIWHETKGYLEKNLSVVIEDGQTTVHDMNLVTAGLLSRP